MPIDLLSKEGLKSIIQHRGGPHVSLYMPTHRTVPETLQDPIRLKKLLRQAENLLLTMGIDGEKSSTILAPARTLLEAGDFWKHLSDGLVVFLADHHAQHHTLPLRFEERVTVDERFYIKPLLPLFNSSGRFYVLALSQNETRFLEGTRVGLRQMEFPEMPTNMDEALRYDQPESHLQFRTGVVGKAGSGSAIFHGHGAGIDDQKERILQYFRLVDRAIAPVLGNGSVPLIIAGVEFLLPIYKAASNYRNILDDAISGNPERMGEPELHAVAWPIVRAFFQSQERHALEIYTKLKSNRRTSTNIGDILRNAEYGRVEYLFTGDGVERWGRYDPSDKSTRLHTRREKRDDDLIDLAARFTLLNNGSVVVLDRMSVPDGAPLAAVYRY